MKYSLIIAIFFLSCSQPEKNSVDTINKDSTKNKLNEVSTIDGDPHVKIRLTNDLMSLKVYELGSMTHFTDKCQFYFECDCCKSEFSLNGDSTFYLLSYCVSDISLTKGNYYIDNNRLTLNFDSIRIDSQYNWLNETDTSEVDVILSDTLVNIPTHTFYAAICRDSLMMVSYPNEKSIAVVSEKKYKSFINELEQMGFLERLAN